MCIILSDFVATVAFPAAAAAYLLIERERALKRLTDEVLALKLQIAAKYPDGGVK